MKLFNTLTKNIEEVKPLEGNTIRMYSCGPTVYDHIHIGNLSSFIFADTVRRVMTLSGYEAVHVMNFTDVDDKTIKRAQESGESDPIQALKAVTEKYAELFLTDMTLIGNDSKSMSFVKATENIDAMQLLIKDLYDSGIAYIAEDGVYFSIAKYKAAGKTYGQLLNITTDSTSESRIQNDEYDKESAHDFALWKKHKNQEPSWEFELDGQDMNGRPGWHIECSAMSRAALGQPFDIHTGGIDLIFPHHENEIAQSTALTENPVMSAIFAHNEHLLIDGRKMSKSLNNFYTLEDLAQKGFDPLAFRLLVLQAHYRNQTNFTWESLEAAQNRLTDLRNWADLRHQPSPENNYSEELTQLFKETKQQILDDVQNDLNTPAALASLSKLVNYMSNQPVPPFDSENILELIDDIFGFKLSERPDITPEQKQLIEQREIARQNKDFPESDRLRTELQKHHLVVRDTAYGPQWARI